MELNTIQMIAVWALPVLFAITAHEAAHAFAAKKLGDPTAFMLGRMTFNPIKHIDPVGTILLPLICVLLPGGFLFGYAKPVPVDFNRLKNPKRDMRWVAAAGPLANFVMAFFWALLFRFATTSLEGNSFQLPLGLMSQAGIQINVVLMVLNLLPIPPLDGGRIAVSLLPPHQARALMKVEPYGLFILIGLLVTGLLATIMTPLMAMVMRVIQIVL
ncbi:MULTISPECIES: site-2 protease family protein [Deefgea]|uniref:Site-2 protease family protein n=1 Tax=Deefgea chitinilytica TaxID=570276 RepID=A0ABS2C916_9NEIS|nr:MULTISPECIES: site-2 protease family protein [Deefgea]MBM5570644.1 site-2 protease family protein [Deefgea chitinilytica]MBM9887873.1 site-2 protease family protein [Deefgea sp. CFH1-16]